MSDQLDILRLVARRFEENGIPYMLTGSVAMSFYAVPRMTRDIDLIAEIASSGARRVHEAFKADFYVDPDDVAEAARSRGSFNMIHNATLVKVDVLIRKDEPYRKTEFERRREKELAGGRVMVVAPEDLLLSKLAWAKDSASEMQMKDAKNVAQASEGLDRPYLEAWAARLGLSELLKEALG